MAMLATAGEAVTQTTVSRDIAELELVKVRDGDGRVRYARRGTRDQSNTGNLVQALKTWALTLDTSGNLVLATTPNGYADPLAQAIDQSGHPRILGTIAGENAVLIVASEGTSGQALKEELSELAARE